MQIPQQKNYEIFLKDKKTMSVTQFYNGRLIMDYSGKLAPVRMRIDSSQSEAASAALSNMCNILSLGKQIVETGEYTDYQVVTAFPDNSAINYNVFRLTLVDNIDSSVKEYMYIPSANLGLLSNNLDYIPDTSSTFSQIASYVQPYYRSRLGNGCTLTAIEYVNQRNTIFPSQVGTATFAPQQVKTTNISENGQYIVNPDSGYIMGRNIINVDVPTYASQTKSVTYTSNGSYSITPDTGYLLSNASITVNVSKKIYFDRVVLPAATYIINSTNFIKVTASKSFTMAANSSCVYFSPGLYRVGMYYVSTYSSMSVTIVASSSEPSYYCYKTGGASRLATLKSGSSEILVLYDWTTGTSEPGFVNLPNSLFEYSGTWW